MFVLVNPLQIRLRYKKPGSKISVNYLFFISRDEKKYIKWSKF